VKVPAVNRMLGDVTSKAWWRWPGRRSSILHAPMRLLWLIVPQRHASANRSFT